MNKRLTLAGLFLLTISSLCFFSGGCAPAEPFTLIVLPDTQNYADTRIGYAAQHWGHGDLRETFYRQTEWIKENKDRLNIVMVAHVGDLVQTDYDPEWEIASEAFETLDGEVPYILCLGNHDMGYAPGPGATGQSAVSRQSRFNEYFGPARFEPYAWYGGHRGSDNNNYYCLFEAGGMKFLIVSLEFKPTDDMLAWAGDVVRRHRHHRCIVLTHSYLRGNERIARDNYGVSGHSGQTIWETFVSQHENIFMVLCGHTDIGRLTSRGRHGNEVHQILSDYQSWQDGGAGYLRIMTFVPGQDRIDVATFSPVRGDTVTTEQNAFSLDYSMTRARSR